MRLLLVFMVSFVGVFSILGHTVFASDPVANPVLTPSETTPSKRVPGPPPKKVADDYAALCKKAAPKGFNRMVRIAAQRYEVNPRVLALTVYRESGCDSSAQGSSGEIGLAQILPSVWRKTLKMEGLIRSDSDLYDPMVNLRAAAFILRELRSQAAGPKTALRMYNGRGDRAERYAAAQARKYILLWGEPLWILNPPKA